MQRNDIIEGKVVDLGSNGEGVVKVSGVTVFVPFALVGETVEIKILKVNKAIAFGKLMSVKRASSDRVKPKCGVFTKCGGCQLQHMNYNAQLKMKGQTIKTCLSKIAKIEIPSVQVVASDKQYAYRNKLQLPIRNISGENCIGFFASNSHRIVPIKSCAIQPSWSSQVIAVMTKFIKTTRVTCFNDVTKKGLLKHIIVRAVDDNFLITLVVTSKKFNYAKELVELFKQEFKSFSLFININDTDSNVILGDITRCVHGNLQFKTEQMGITTQMGAMSFMQVNDFIKQEIYNSAVMNSGVDSQSIVIDAYSGAGLMTAMFAKHAKKAIGIEVVPEAIECANLVVEQNGLEGKMTNICGDCGKELARVAKTARNESNNLILVLDPPRQGVSSEIMQMISQVLPNKIIYISCSPQTLARDIGILNDNTTAYELEKVIGYDMFPQTKHVETLAVMTLKA